MSSVVQTLPPPKSAWMWKPKSKVTDDHSGGGGAMGGFLGSAQGMFGAIRNNVGPMNWNRRYAVIDGAAFHYGKQPGNKEKSIALETIRGATLCTRDEMKQQRAPDKYVDFGWKLIVAGRDITFCCEDDATRQEWVSYLEQLIAVIGGGGSRSGASAGHQQCRGTAGDDHPNGNGGGESEHYGTTTAAMAARAQDQERERMTQRSVAPSARGGGDDDEQGPDLNNTKSQTELRTLVGGADDDDDDLDFENILGGGDDDDLEDEFSEDELMDAEEGEMAHGDGDTDGGRSERGGGVRPAHASPRGTRGHKEPLVSVDDAYRTFLMPIAKTPYSHIQYRLEKYAKHFAKDDSLSNVLFSREVDKIGKSDKSNKRDLVVTSKYLYLLPSQAMFIMPHEVRAVELNQLVGVVESTLESNLLALIIPSWHDVLLRITHQTSLIGGNEVQVKHQLIAHLYAALKKLNTGRQFLFREAENVRAVIRRDDQDRHQPLMSAPGDTLKCASQSGLYSVFRINADSKILWSSVVTRLNAERVSSRRIFVVADSAFYFVSDDCKRVQRRTPLREVSRILYDVDLQGILIKCVDVDALFTIKDTTEFQQAKQTLLEACDAIGGHRVRMLSSKQLFSNAQLVETKKLREMFGDNADGLKKGMQLTRRMLKNSWKLGMKSVGFVTDSVAKVGGAGVDLLRTAGKEVGGALVDNQLTGELLGVLGATALSSPKVIFETLLSYQDEEQLLRSADPFVDQLRINNTPQVAEHKLGTVGYSSRGGLFNLSATIDHNKTEDRLVIISQSGVTLFHPPDAAFSLLSPLRGILAQLSNGLKLDTHIGWSAITGVIRCSQDDNVVGLQTNNQRHADLMLRIPNASLLSKFVAIAAVMYVRHNGSRKFMRQMLNIYAAPRMENVRAALKKTIFDFEAPSVALRVQGSIAADALMLSIVPDIADMLRRFGDNTVFFSGVAWRLRSSSTRKGAERVGQIMKDEDAKDNKLFKSFLLVLTNCAVYQISKGGYEIGRRTDIRDVTAVMVSKEDPNALLLVVPTEFDIFFRVDGRGQEFLDRMQEAYATWTSFGLQLATALGKPQSPADFFVPLSTVEELASIGKLEKPANFNHEQANRSAAETQKQYQMWHKNKLVLCVVKHRNAMEAAAAGMIFEPENVPGYDASAATTASFADVFVGLENAVVAVQFTQERAYRFGLRASQSAEMAAAQRVLLEWNDVCSVAEDLQRAIVDEDIERYEERFDDLSGYPAFALLLKEQSGVFETLRRKKEALSRITGLLDDKSYAIISRERALADAFRDAVAANVKPSTIASLRQQADVRVQREKLTANLLRIASEGELASLPTTTKHLLRDAALQLGIETSVLEAAFGASARKGSVIGDASTDTVRAVDRPRLKAATCAVKKAVALGDAKLLGDVLGRAKQLLSAANEDRSSFRAGALAALEELDCEIAFGAQQLLIVEQHDDVIRDLNHMRQQLRSKPNLRGGGGGVAASDMTSLVTELERYLDNFAALHKRLHAREVEEAPVLATARDICDLQTQKLREKLFAVKEELKLGHREAQVLADAREAQRQREEAERARLAEERRLEESSAHQRRLEFLNMWILRSQKLTVAIKGAVHASDTPMVKQCIRNCVVFQGDVKQSFQTVIGTTTAAAATTGVAEDASSLSPPSNVGASVGQAAMTTPVVNPEYMAMYNNLLEDILKKLSHAAHVGQRYLDRVDPASRDGQHGSGGDGPGDNTISVPEELPRLLQQGSTTEIVDFIAARQGTLNLKTVREIRNLWTQAKAKRQWIANLHKSLRTAFSLHNPQLLEEHIMVAKADGYVDDYVLGAMEILRVMREEEAAKSEAELGGRPLTPVTSSVDNAQAQQQDDSPQITIAPVPQAIIHSLSCTTNPRGGSSTPGSATHALATLHRALAQLAASPANTAGIEHPNKIRPVDDSSELRYVVQSWIDVLQHRVKPSGLFRKVERSVFDVLLFVGNFTRSGDIIAPYANRVCSDFERIKRFNNPNGHSSAYMLVSYLLIHNDLATLLGEMQRIGIKDLGDVFYDDSLHRNASLSGDVKLLLEMTEQFEWPFTIHERSSVATNISIARSVEQQQQGAAAGGPTGAATTTATLSYRGADGTDPNASLEQRRKDSATRAVAMLRLSIQAISAYFAKQLKSIGSSPSTEATRRILDERVNKEVGIIVREQLCPALMAVLSSGMRTYHLLSKRRLWEVLNALGEELRESARGLGGVGIPDAVDMVAGITDINGRNKVVLHRMDDDLLSDVRVRMLLCHSLNQGTLAALVECLFDPSSTHAPFLKKYYNTERSMMVPLQASEPAQVALRVIRMLSDIPFALTIDAEVW